MIGSIGSTGGTAPSAPSQLTDRSSLGKDDFLQLLVSQLRNQDPLNPADPKDFAAQLAQFSSVEQLLNIGEQLAAQAEGNAMLLESMYTSSALQLVGRTVLATGDGIDMPAEGSARATVHVAEGGGSGALVMYDEAGNEVARLELPRLEAGRQTIDLSELVGQVEAGRYTYAVELEGASGEPVDVQTFAVLRIDGVRFTSSGPVLTSGPVSIALGDVIEIGE